MRIIRTTNPNGTYRYEIDGEVQMKASKVLYTHASSYAVGEDGTPVMFHKTEAAAGRAKGYPRLGWVKLSVHVIEDGDATAQVAQHALTIANLAAVLMEKGRLRVSTGLSSAAITTTLDIARGNEATRAAGLALAHGHDADIREAFKTSVPPAVRAPRAPRVRAKVIANAGPSHLRGRQGRVQSKGRGDDGELYVTVDFGNDVTWPFLVSELTVV